MLSRCRAALRVASVALHAPPASSGLPRTAAGAALTRDPRFNTVMESDLARFRDILGGPSAVVTDEAELAAYNEDWIKKYRGASRVALKPKTTAQVSAVIAHCNERRLAVVPQGGNTGLVGGSVPVFDEVVLSTTNMNNIVDIDVAAGVAVAQAGVVLERLDNALAEHGLCVPLDLGAKGSCQIGACFTAASLLQQWPAAFGARQQPYACPQAATFPPTPADCACCDTARCTAPCSAWRWCCRTDECSTCSASCAKVSAPEAEPWYAYR